MKRKFNAFRKTKDFTYKKKKKTKNEEDIYKCMNFQNILSKKSKE